MATRTKMATAKNISLLDILVQLSLVSVLQYLAYFLFYALNVSFCQILQPLQAMYPQLHIAHILKETLFEDNITLNSSEQQTLNLIMML